MIFKRIGRVGEFNFRQEKVRKFHPFLWRLRIFGLKGLRHMLPSFPTLFQYLVQTKNYRWGYSDFFYWIFEIKYWIEGLIQRLILAKATLGNNVVFNVNLSEFKALGFWNINTSLISLIMAKFPFILGYISSHWTLVDSFDKRLKSSK